MISVKYNTFLDIHYVAFLEIDLTISEFMNKKIDIKHYGRNLDIRTSPMLCENNMPLQDVLQAMGPTFQILNAISSPG